MARGGNLLAIFIFTLPATLYSPLKSQIAAPLELLPVTADCSLG
jgi:hypothetical protein